MSSSSSRLSNELAWLHDLYSSSSSSSSESSSESSSLSSSLSSSSSYQGPTDVSMLLYPSASASSSNVSCVLEGVFFFSFLFLLFSSSSFSFSPYVLSYCCFYQMLIVYVKKPFLFCTHTHTRYI